MQLKIQSSIGDNELKKKNIYIYIFPLKVTYQDPHR